MRGASADHSRLPPFLKAGGLLSGHSRRICFGARATVVDKILKGAKPADIPVEQPTAWNLSIQSHDRQGSRYYPMPTLLLATADEVLTTA